MNAKSEDILRGGNQYRIIVQPFGISSPYGRSVTVFQLFPGPKALQIAQKTEDAGETEQDLLEWARRRVDVHASAVQV
jgi:hypothetical protein